MQFSLFQPLPYFAPELPRGWPQSPSKFDPRYGLKSVQRNMEIIEAADAGGFDYISVAEHHYAARQMCPSPALAAALIVQRVKRAKIAILGVDLPLHNPVQVAEELAMLDTFSGGNLLVGLFRGTPNEYATYGHNPGESKAMFEEGVELLLKAWSEPEPFGWEGVHYRHRMVSIWPQPVQRPRPPVLVSGNSPSSIEFAARHRLKIGLSFLPVEFVPQAVAAFHEAAERHGWRPGPEDVLWRGFAYVAETDDNAREVVEKYNFGDLYGILAPTERQAPSFLSIVSEVMEAGFGGASAGGGGSLQMPPPQPIAGSPDKVVEQLRTVQEAGVGIADLIVSTDAVPPELSLEAVKLLGRDVIPAFR
ncbi:LLM class flavin-dependent oxidoreductase [Streptomyces griseorubiginosus]|uniref:LLM class flavin-dependent oxidoreductase n=1 Tax=Streptomyces griseorubiginosus TaxID=67304 RepID=UPI001AD7A488|nr:LLM class flavin-dependent oxidoreductase [Streptomyces griseorubiginosus]MBO4252317.1 LLM class flavin-dependent oxidoreductase [Streptomyces griseorubiginosus]